MVSSVPPRTPPSAAELMEQLAAARGEVAKAAATSKAMRRQALAESLYQAARLAKDAGDGSRADALVGEADRVDAAGLDLKI